MTSQASLTVYQELITFTCNPFLSLGYSVAVGEFTGDSEQGEKSPQFITTKPRSLPTPANTVAVTHRSRQLDARREHCEGVFGDKEWTAV